MLQITPIALNLNTLEKLVYREIEEESIALCYRCRRATFDWRFYKGRGYCIDCHGIVTRIR
jgi:hypothetical protein